VTRNGDRSSGVIVVGMHRAGTSLATSLAAHLGFVAAGKLMPPLDDNPRGFWEHEGISQTHEIFLQRLGRDWSDPTPLPANAFSGDAAASAREDLVGHLECDLLPQPRWVLKDPRFCRLLPLWEPLLERDDLDVRYLLVLRSPAAVVASLAHRNGMPASHSLLLWLDHFLEAERWTRHRPRHWFDFDRFTRSPGEVCDELEAWLYAGGTSAAADDRKRLESIYDPDLVHHGHINGDDLAPVSAEPWITETYAALLQLAGAQTENPSALAALDAVHTELSRAGEFLDRPFERQQLEKERNQARTERDHLQHENHALQRDKHALEQRQEQLEATLTQVFASRSWRWTKPLRRENR